jgi:hypothetical protein
MMKNYLNAAQRHKSVGGEIICARKILDAHLHSNSSKYVWEDNFVFDLIKHSEQKICYKSDFFRNTGLLLESLER